MEHLNISASRNTPSVSYNAGSNTFSIVGNSIPENAGEFYTPVIQWIKSESPALPDGTTFAFCLPYFNSSSLKAIYLVLMEIKNVMDTGKKFELVWYIEEEDDFMSEAAETYNEMVGVQLTMKTGMIAA